MNQKSSGIPPLLIEQLVLGELPPGAEHRLREQFGQQEVEQAVERVRGSNASLRAASKTEPMVSAIERRLSAAAQRPEPRRSTSVMRQLSWAIGPAFAAAAAIWFSVQGPSGSELDPNAEATAMIRFKGNEVSAVAESGETQAAGAVLVYRKPKGSSKAGANAPNPGVEQLRDGDEARAGDVLQLGYVSHRAYGALLSLDGVGQVTLHWPSRAAASPKLPEREGLLNHSYELDDSPEFERFFLVTSPSEFSVQDVLGALERLGRDSSQASRLPPPLPPQFSTVSVLIKKVSP